MVRRAMTITTLIGAVTLLTGCSGGTTTSVAVPRGWRAVSYSGLTIDVPGTWPVVLHTEAPCGIQGPGVVIGPPLKGAYRCPDFVAGSTGPELAFSGPGVIVPVGHETRGTFHGVRLAMSIEPIYAGLGEPRAEEVVVRFPGRGVWIRAYVPGTTGGRAFDLAILVITTVHPASVSTAVIRD